MAQGEEVVITLRKAGVTWYYAPGDPGLGMFSPLLSNASRSKSFLWTFPECPVRIHVDFQFIDRLRAEVVDPAPRDREEGGLLLGNQLSLEGELEISGYLRLPSVSESVQQFVICSDALTQAIQNPPAGHRQVIGFYRTHLEKRMELRAQDLQCIRSKFNHPANVFLIIRPHDGRASASFFFWQDGAVNGGLTFPFSSAELQSSSWATLVGGAPRESELQSLFGRARERAPRLGSGMKIGLVAVLAILIVLAAVLRLYQPAADSPQPLGLRVERALLGVVVAWNPAAPEIATAKDADLLIWDGSSPPAFVRLSNAQLRAGRTFFTSISDRVEVRLDIIGAAGRARTESIVSVAHSGDVASPPVPAAQEARAVPPGETQPAPETNVAAPTPAAKRPNPATKSTAPGKTASAAPVAPLQQSGQSPAATARQPATRSGQAAPLTADNAGPGSFQSAVPIRETRPEIPPELRPLIQSDNVVEVHVHISASGKVTAANLESVRGPMAASLSKSAVSAALNWQFRPATQNGEAVPSDKILEFLFRPSTR